MAWVDPEGPTPGAEPGPQVAEMRMTQGLLQSSRGGTLSGGDIRVLGSGAGKCTCEMSPGLPDMAPRDSHCARTFLPAPGAPRLAR